MTILRLLSLFACCLLMIVLPVLLSGSADGGLPLLLALPVMVGVGLLAAGFVYVGLLADRMRRSSATRRIAIMLMVPPALACLAILSTSHDTVLLSGSALLLACTVLLLACVLNAHALGRRRSMRRRDPQAPGGLLQG
jgi:hypothetical protein